MSAVVDHIKNVFKHKKQHERTKNVTNAAEKNTEKRKKENIEIKKNTKIQKYTKIKR
jgi:hypothetical protein